MNKDLEEFLIENINNDDVLDNLSESIKLYRQPKSNYNEEDHRMFKYYMMREYHANGKPLSSLFRLDSEQEIGKLLDDIPKDLSLEDFIAKVKSIEQQTGTLESATVNRFNRKVLGSNNPVLVGWNYIYSDKLGNAPVHQKDYRIYLPIDNSCLHRFAVLLTEECKKNDIDYYFKINYDNDSSFDTNQYDNVVVYLAQEELEGYVRSIRTVLFRHPEIKTNQPSILGYNLDGTIVITPDLEDGIQSYTDIVCGKIVNLRDTETTRADFLMGVDTFMSNLLNPVQEYCEKNIVIKKRGLL